MKYEKAMVTIIELTEDIVTSSYECNTQGSSYAGCNTAGSQLSATCTSGNHVDKGQCDTNGHIHAVGP